MGHLLNFGNAIKILVNSQEGFYWEFATSVSFPAQSTDWQMGDLTYMENWQIAISKLATE